MRGSPEVCHKLCSADVASGHTEFDKAWRVLLSSFAAATAYTLAAVQWPVVKSFPVFSWIGLPSVTAWGWELSPSLGYVGQGMIMGPRSAVSMLLGAIAGTIYLAFNTPRESRLTISWLPDRILTSSIIVS